MANRDFEIDLRMKADFSSADRAFAKTEDNLDRVRQAAREVNREIASTSSPTGPTGATGAQAEGEAVDALNTALQGNVTAREAQIAASRATQVAVSAEIGLIADLQERLARSAGSFDDLADTEARLDMAMSKGLITTEEYDAALVKLDQDQKRLVASQEKSDAALGRTVARYDKAGAGLERLVREEGKLKQAVDAGRISREQYNRAIEGIGNERKRLSDLRNGANESAKAMRGLNFESMGVQRNLTQLLTYAATGNFNLAGAQLLQLGNQAGVARVLLSGLGATLLATSLGAGLFTAAIVKNYLELRAYDTALIATGNYAGTTAGELTEAGRAVGQVTGEFGKARDATLALANSGKLSGDVLQAAASAAVNLSELTGRSIEDTTQQIIRLAAAPSAQLLELNQQYNFLTAEVYEHVTSLEAQGRAEDATRVAVEEFARVHEQRVQEARERAGLLEHAWVEVSGAIKRASQAALDFGRQDIEAQLTRVTGNVARIRGRMQDIQDDFARGLGNRADATADLAANQRKLDNELKIHAQLREQLYSDQSAAREEANQARVQKAGVAALSSINRTLDEGRTKTEQLGKATKDLQKQFRDLREANPDSALLADVQFAADGGVSGGAFDKALAGLQDKFKEKKEKPKKTDDQRAEESAQRELGNLQQQIDALDSLEEGQQKVSEAARIRFEIEEGAYKNASEATKQALVDNAQLLDGERARIDAAKVLANANLELLRLRGDTAGAVDLELQREFGATVQHLENTADEAGLKIMASLFDAKKAQAALTEIERAAETTFGAIAREEQRINIEQEAGLISGIEAQEKLLELRQREIEFLQQQIPLLEAQAALLGDPAVTARIEDMKLKLYELQQQGTLLETTFRTSVQSGIQNALEGLADGTLTLKEAVIGTIQDIAAGMASLAAQQLASMATAKLMSAFGKGKGNTPDLASPDPAQAAAAGVAYAAPITAAAGALALSATPLLGAAAALQAAAVSLAAANAVGSLGGAGFASGGKVSGPGTGTSDSILARISNDEFITRAAVVRQPGALPFLMDFNDRGMSALAAWQKRFASVGMPRIPVPAMPRYNFASGGLAQGGGIAPQLKVALYNLLDSDSLLDAIADNPRFDKVLLNRIDANKDSVRASVSN